MEDVSVELWSEKMLHELNFESKLLKASTLEGKYYIKCWLSHWFFRYDVTNVAGGWWDKIGAATHVFFCTVVVVIAMLQRGGVTQCRFSDVWMHSAPWAAKLNVLFHWVRSWLFLSVFNMVPFVVGEVRTLGLCSL